jgi:hypothetical protein
VKRRIVIRLPRWVKRRLRREGHRTRDAALRTRIQIWASPDLVDGLITLHETVAHTLPD